MLTCTFYCPPYKLGRPASISLLLLLLSGVVTIHVHTIVVAGIQLVLDREPSFGVNSIDVRNAFNEGDRAKILDAVWNEPRLRGMMHVCTRDDCYRERVGSGCGTRCD